MPCFKYSSEHHRDPSPPKPYKPWKIFHTKRTPYTFHKFELHRLNRIYVTDCLICEPLPSCRCNISVQRLILIPDHRDSKRSRIFPNFGSGACLRFIPVAKISSAIRFESNVSNRLFVLTFQKFELHRLNRLK